MLELYVIAFGVLTLDFVLGKKNERAMREAEAIDREIELYIKRKRILEGYKILIERWKNSKDSQSLPIPTDIQTSGIPASIDNASAIEEALYNERNEL